MKLIYFNDTGRFVRIHPATLGHGCIVSKDPIKPLETREFLLPKDTIPWVKMWDEKEMGLRILVSPLKETEK
ncbi:hypothetical protein [Cytobacillus solani]|uniref:Uncharacterized protein n=1 Tax=Cytobacillus solani TaxID=1637975 RepID=A0A0Q3SHW7_9BACI|nr:hypothetical protein [Cytobacillus solani]KQL19084.1 hypothetical protein AN957_11140 [Cytobacillus solani]